MLSGAEEQAEQEESFEDALEAFDDELLGGLWCHEDGCSQTDKAGSGSTPSIPVLVTAVHMPVQASPKGESPASVPREWTLHRAAFAGDVEMLKSALAGISKEQLRALDPQGNSALHVAVLRRHKDCVNLLLEAGLPGGQRNSRGWGALYQAIEMRDRDLALMLLQADMAHVKADVKAKKAAVMQKLWELPDFSMQLHWQLSSSVPGVGMLLSRYAPNDTYTIWKQGCQIRVDGSLMGVREGGQSLLPEWKRGHFSLLYNGSGGGENGKPLGAFVNWTKKKWVDLQAARKRMGTMQEAVQARQVDELMAELEVVSRKVKAAGFKFAPVSGWLTKEVTEKVEGWDTKVYEASGGMVAETKYKAPISVPAALSWEEYLALRFADDICEQEVLNPLGGKMFSEKAAKQQAGPEAGRRRAAPAATSSVPHAAPASQGTGSARQDGPSGDAKDKSKNAKKLTGRCWMATGFPLSLQQLLPLLDVIGSANKHIAKVSKFLSKYGSMDMFPVKIQVPIMFTVYALIQFKKFKLTSGDSSTPTKQPGLLKRGAGSSNSNAPLPAGFFDVPIGFEKYEPKIFTRAEDPFNAEEGGFDDVEL